MHWFKMEPRKDEAPGPPLSAKVSFARIGPAVLKLPSDNHRVSNSVFKVKRIIEELETGNFLEKL